jgi:hypothetical protein
VVCIDLRSQTHHVVPRCSFQRVGHGVYGRLYAVRKAATDPLVNTEDDAMTGRIYKPRPENISNATCQHKVIVPLALAQQRIRKSLGEHLPASIEQRRTGPPRHSAGCKLSQPSTINLPGPPDATAAGIQDLKMQLARDILTRDRVARPMPFSSFTGRLLIPVKA